MRITLVSPQSYRPNVVLEQMENYSLNPPVALLYLAAGTAPNHDVCIIDNQLRKLSTEKLVEEVLATNPDVVGVSVNFTTVVLNAQVLARALKSRRPEMLVVAGGNCATFLSGTLCSAGGFDAVFLREADRSFPAFVDALESCGDPWATPGLVFHRGGKTETNTFAGYLRNLDELPAPRYDLLPDRERYLATVVSSRGCSFNCIYCSTKSMWQHWRFRSPEHVLAEIDGLWALGYRSSLAFCDDEFITRRARVLTIAGMLEERKYRYRWGFAGRIELIDGELLAAVSRSGCEQIFFGIESGSDAVRQQLKRRCTAEEVERVVDLCIEHGIVPIVSFMVGNPYETREDVLKTLGLMRRINTYKVQMSVFTPLLGTPVFERPDEFGLQLDPRAYDLGSVNIDVGTVVHDTRHLSKEEIRDLWLEGQGILMRRYQERSRYEAAKAAARAKFAEPAAAEGATA